ncbi:helix-hairpin-helix domain-containing protein [Streptomyces sp. NPDC089799]|uniref:helix-hairpin-helix domain-containing protein n=1 Tax=Streptomyces sp. NPDC089799 TaxID=3155066 RepID=UPI00341CF8C5
MDEWWLVFVPDPERWGPLPEEGVLGVRDLPAAVAAVGLQPGDPVFARPDFAVDSELLEFVLSPEFHPLERETRRKLRAGYPTVADLVVETWDPVAAGDRERLARVPGISV